MYGSSLCPDCQDAMKKLAEKKISYDFCNATNSTAELKEFCYFRDGHPEIYDEVRSRNGLGIPCFLLDDGTATLDISKVL